MSNWLFTTPTVREAPAAWNPLHERYSLNRGVSVQEVSPHVYALVRYDAYTNELGAVNLPVVPTDPYPEPSAGLHYFRGGYEWIVNDTVKADLISSGIGIDNSNFVPAP